MHQQDRRDNNRKMFSTGRLPKLVVEVPRTNPSIPNKRLPMPSLDQPSRYKVMSNSCNRTTRKKVPSDDECSLHQVKVSTFDLSEFPNEHEKAAYESFRGACGPIAHSIHGEKERQEMYAPKKSEKKTTRFPGLDPAKIAPCTAVKTYMMPLKHWKIKGAVLRDLNDTESKLVSFNPMNYTGYQRPEDDEEEEVARRSPEHRPTKSKKKHKKEADPLTWAPMSVRRLFGVETPGVPPRESKVRLHLIDGKRLQPGAPVRTSVQRALTNSLLIVYLFEVEDLEEIMNEQWDHVGNLKGIARILQTLRDRVDTISGKCVDRIEDLTKQFKSGSYVTPCVKPSPTLLEASYPRSAPYPKGLITPSKEELAEAVEMERIREENAQKNVPEYVPIRRKVLDDINKLGYKEGSINPYEFKG